MASGSKGLIKSVHCGADFSFLLTISGRVLAFGNNECNQLGLNSANTSFRKNNSRVSHSFMIHLMDCNQLFNFLFC